MASDLAGHSNLLVCLSQWATRQDENFLTEAFVHLLRHLITEESKAALQLLTLVTGERLDVTADDLPLVEISTQVITDQGRPDIEIRFGGHLIYVEAKVESGLGEEQLKRYRQALDDSQKLLRTLVLLSRYAVSEKEVSEVPDVWLRWFQIGDLLHEQLDYDIIEAPESRYLARQLVSFLRSKGMIMDHVGWEMTSGVRSMLAFIKMLTEALNDLNISMKRSAGANFMGFWVTDAKNIWLGIRYTEPQSLRFHTYFKINPEDWLELGAGQIEPLTDVEGGQSWCNTLELESEAVHFFARSRASQQEVLREFIQDSLMLVRGALDKSGGNIDIPAPVPDEQET